MGLEVISDLKVLNAGYNMYCRKKSANMNILETAGNLLKSSTVFELKFKSINFPNIHKREKLSWLIGVSRESFCVGDLLIKIVNQDLCKRNFLENLKSHEVLVHVIADWTMIYLGSKASAGIWIVLVSVTHIQMTLTTVTSLTLFPWFL